MNSHCQAHIKHKGIIFFITVSYKHQYLIQKLTRELKVLGNVEYISVYALHQLCIFTDVYKITKSLWPQERLLVNGCIFHESVSARTRVSFSGSIEGGETRGRWKARYSRLTLISSITPSCCECGIGGAQIASFVTLMALSSWLLRLPGQLMLLWQ